MLNHPAVQALVVEDEVFIVLDLEDALREQGLRIAAAFSSNEQALEWLRDHRPDVAIIDFRLRDGYSEAVARGLRELEVPTLVYSGNAYEPSLHEADYGSFPWLEKPASLDALSSALQPLLRAALERRC